MIKEIFREFFFRNWFRRAAAFILALIIWALVNDSIMVTKVLENVSIKVINIKPDRTIIDLLPDGKLSQGINLTINGPRKKLESVSNKDIEIVIDAADRHDEWVAEINKKSIVSLSPHFDLQSDSLKISSTNVIIKLSKLVTEKISVKVAPPIGEAPESYQFLDIWPTTLVYRIKGPEPYVKEIKSKGLNLTLDLNKVSEEDLDQIQSVNKSEEDEISFFVPKHWKKLNLPWPHAVEQEVMSSSANKLRINFLKKDLLPLDREIPLHMFFPLRNSDWINPTTHSLLLYNGIENRNAINLLKVPLHVKDVSRLFLDVVKDYLEIAIVIDPEKIENIPKWSLEFINPELLERRYVKQAIEKNKELGERNLSRGIQEDLLRTRFRNYMRECSLFMDKNKPLDFSVEIKSNVIFVRVAGMT